MSTETKTKKAAPPKERLYGIILAPLITEKATMGSQHNQVTFKVRLDATKPEIRAAVDGLRGDIGRQREAGQDAVSLDDPVADEEADVVPLFGQLGGRQPFELRNNLADARHAGTRGGRGRRTRDSRS